MPYTTLIDTETLAAHVSDPAFVVLDSRFNLSDPAWGLRDYLAHHIPDAAYADLDRDLSGVKTGANGRHPLPTVAALAATFSRMGIDDDVQVVAYDQDIGMYASRLWWLLRWLGHDAVAVLDGGFAKWLAEKRPTAAGAESHTPRHFTARPRAEAALDVDDVTALVSGHEGRLLDARAPERFRGEVETIDKAAGHIPGATNYFFKWNLTEAGTFLPLELLRSKLEKAIADTPLDRVVCYCGSGVTACHNLLALEHASLHGAKLYAGSWSEWSSDPRRPISRGGD